MNSRYLILGSTLTIATAYTCLAAPMIGNLEEFPPAGVGDVRTPTAGIYFGTAFQTDAKAYYTLDSIALEQYLFDAGNTVQVQLLRQNGLDWAPVAELGQPMAAGMPTPFPSETTFVSYAPASEVVLEPGTTYMVAVGQPVESPIFASVLFTSSQNYVAAEGWSMASDHAGMVIGNALLWGSAWQPGHLKFQVDATFNRPANTPPDVSQAQASVQMLWPPNGTLVPFEISGVTDPNGDPVTVTVTSIVQDEPIAADGTAPDAIVSWGAPAMVRAERLGNGNGRVYTIAFQADDGKGGIAAGVVYITVPHDGGAAAIDDGPTSGYYLSTGIAPAQTLKPKRHRK